MGVGNLERGVYETLQTPVNAAIVEVVKAIDAGAILPDPSNVERVLGLAGL